ncbi:hypothetical protein TI05_15700, partial [Achromatium sp. WMS3]
MTLKAAQLIYTNVEKEQSPTARGGFQTVLSTHDSLNKNQIRQIEQYLQYNSGFTDPIKKLFFTINQGQQIVLVHIHPMPDADAFKHSERYFAHALIFEAKDWDNVRAEPLSILRTFSFFETVEQALDQGDFTTGNIGLVEVETSIPIDSVQIKLWNLDTLIQMVLYAAQANLLARRKQSLAYIGSPEDMTTVLEPILRLVPNVLRKDCCFDSFFYKCNPVANYFWAVGLPEEPLGGKFIKIDIAKQQIITTSPLQPNTIFEHWITKQINAGSILQIFEAVEDSWLLCNWLDNKLTIEHLPEQVPEWILSTISELNETAIIRQARVRLNEVLPKTLVELIAPRLELSKLDGERYAELRLGFAVSPLLDLVFEELTNPGSKKWPPRKVMTAVSTVATSSQHPALSILLAIRHNLWDEVSKLLQSLTNDTYTQIIERFLKCKF